MPRRLARYMLRQTAVMYVLGVAAFCLLISIDFLALWAEYLLEHEATLVVVGRLMLYRFPWFLHLSLPVAVVMAVLLVTGRMAKDSELKAAYALGVNPASLLLPLLLFGVLVSGLSLFNNGYLEPLGERHYNELVESFFYTRPPNEVQSNAAYAIPDAGIYYAARIRSDRDDPDSAELSGILVRRPDDSTITAPSGIWDSEERLWVLEEAQRLEPGEEPVPVGRVTLPFDLDSGAQETLSGSEILSLPELSQRISTIRAAGGETRELRFSFHRQVADAFAAVVFVLIAGTLGLGLHGRAAGFAWTIVLLVIFWATWTLAGNLFDSGVLSPVWAAWFTPAAMAAGGSVLAFWRLRS